MAAANMFFFPSRQEGLGMAAVEAQAAGLPVLASSAVPREAVVIPLLYSSISLDRSIQDWAALLVAVAAQPRQPPEYTREIFQASAFAIENSASALERIYGSRLQ
jgi:glycosyltransferase involved in cell wall biosynthesis